MRTDIIYGINDLRRRMIAILSRLGEMGRWQPTKKSEAKFVEQKIVELRGEIEQARELADATLRNIDGAPLPETSNFLMRAINDLTNVESPTGRASALYAIERRLKDGDFNDVSTLIARWEYDAVMPAVVKEIASANIVAAPLPMLTAEDIKARLRITSEKTARRYAESAGTKLPADYLGAMRIVNYLETTSGLDATAKSNARKLIE